MLAVQYGLKCTSIGKNIKGAICVKVFEPKFVYTVKVASEVQSQIFPIIYFLLHTLEVEHLSRIIHELGIIPSAL